MTEEELNEALSELRLTKAEFVRCTGMSRTLLWECRTGRKSVPTWLAWTLQLALRVKRAGLDLPPAPAEEDTASHDG